ncbi:MAG TPA: hypothetical protein VD998_03420 [Verrucomicrobiae bacterium]|nr:hypothetical protein [Verrucomicrobiae bacterium]
MKKTILILIVILATVAIVWYGFDSKQSTKQQTSNIPELSDNSPGQPPDALEITPPPATIQQVTPPPPLQMPPPAVTPPPARIPPPPPPALLPPPPPPPPTQSVIVFVDDYTASPSAINVTKGNKINLIVNVKEDNVYYGGVELRSSVGNTGPIAPGGTKTVTFIAEQTVVFTPYWPASGVKKDYTLTINVQ